MIDTLLKSLTTGSGFWNPLVWGLAIFIALLLIYIIRGFGKKNTKQVQSKPRHFCLVTLNIAKMKCM